MRVTFSNQEGPRPLVHLCARSLRIFACSFFLPVAGNEPFSIVSTGSLSAPDDSLTGFKVNFEASAKLNISLMLTTMRYSIEYSIPQTNWHHFLITWSQNLGLVLYENGVRVFNGTHESKNHGLNQQPRIFVGYDTVNSNTQLHDLRLWRFRLSDNDAKNLFSPGKFSFRFC